MKHILRLLRTKEWIKNLFVFVPLIFSRQLFAVERIEDAALAFFAFCFLSSSVYILNDIRDCESDKRHPKKKNRPIASGAVSKTTAAVIGVISLLLAAALGAQCGGKVWLALAAYAAINVGYSFSWKHIVLVDVFCIASGFMLRVMAGAWAINVEISQWLILCTLFLSLLLAITKRRSELHLTTESGGDAGTRSVLSKYSFSITEQMTTITASGAVISYALYTVSDRTVKMFGTENLVYTTIFVLYGVFRYLYLEHKESVGENPTDVVSSDVPLIIDLMLWVASSAVIIYGRL